MEKETWKVELNRILWNSVDSTYADSRPVVPTLQKDLEDFIHKVEQSALQRGREEAVEIATEYMEHLQFMKFCDAVLPIT